MLPPLEVVRPPPVAFINITAADEVVEVGVTSARPAARNKVPPAANMGKPRIPPNDEDGDDDNDEESVPL